MADLSDQSTLYNQYKKAKVTNLLYKESASQSWKAPNHIKQKGMKEPVKPPKQNQEQQNEEDEYEKEIKTHLGGRDSLTGHFIVGRNATSLEEDE